MFPHNLSQRVIGVIACLFVQAAYVIRSTAWVILPLAQWFVLGVGRLAALTRICDDFSGSQLAILSEIPTKGSGMNLAEIRL